MDRPNPVFLVETKNTKDTGEFLAVAKDKSEAQRLVKEIPEATRWRKFYPKKEEDADES